MVSGYEVLVVALAIAGLIVLAVSALLGIFVRLTRGRVTEREDGER